nr:hypothetical protein BaRGS_020334 [Batillaria attramentaria]
MDCIQPKKNRNYDQLSQVKTRSKHSVISSPVAKDRFRDCQLDDFKSKKVIAYGSSSKVRLVVEKRTGVYLILKEIYKKKLEDTLMEPWTEKEHVFMSKVRSPWLVEMYQVYETPARLSLLMEYLPGPNLLELVRSGKDLDDQDIRILASEMLMCVFAVHRRGYMHRDIKLSNFILDVRGHVKLCDFASCIRYIKAEICEQLFPEDAGLSVKPPEYVQQAHRTLIQQLEYRPCVPHGTSWYCAPEVIWLTTRQAVRDMEVRRLKGYSYTCDYWSYGVCLYYLMFKKLPFLPADKIRLPSMIIHWRQTLKFQSGKLNVPASGVDIIQRLLRRKKTSCVSPTTTFRSKTGIFSCFKRPSSVKTASSTGMLLTPDYPTRLFSFRFPSGLAGAGRAAFRPECGPPDNASKISLATSSVASSRLSCALSSHSDDTDLTGFTFPLPKDVRVPVKSSLKKSRQRHEVELTTAASETAKGTREFALFHGDVDGDAERLRPGVHAVRSVSFDISTNPQAEAKRQASPGLIRNLFSRIRTASGLFGTDRAETRTESSLQDTSSASTVPGPLQVGTGPTSPSSVHMIFEAAQEEDANSGTENLMEALFHDGAGEVASETQMSNASGT